MKVMLCDQLYVCHILHVPYVSLNLCPSFSLFHFYHREGCVNACAYQDQSLCDLYLIAGETSQNVWKNVELKKIYIFQTIALAEASKCSMANTVILQSAV